MSNYGPKVAWEQLSEGVRIYYTGDMANHDGFGVITKQWHDAGWNYRQVNILMDDGRILRGIHDLGFQPSPGRRFWLEADWRAERERRIAEMKAQWAQAAEARAARS